ncbi:hypothetical protein I545_6908, partial [Mycobacterium kansasii 662]
MTDGILTDDQIAALSPEQRRELISRLERPLGELVDETTLARTRRIGCGCHRLRSGTDPVDGISGLTLPANYVANNWRPPGWFRRPAGRFMTATAVLGYLRRQLLLLTAFTTGVLLICDAWFDLMTAGPDERWWSVLTAIFLELPVAIVMITSAQRIMRLTLARLW